MHELKPDYNGRPSLTNVLDEYLINGQEWLTILR